MLEKQHVNSSQDFDLPFCEKFHNKIIMFVPKEISKWYEQYFVNEIYNLVTANTKVFVVVFVILRHIWSVD